MAIDADDDGLWLKFLQIWPIERLHTMTLDEYTSSGDKNCFVYWIESQLDRYGSIWGGSAFKFGIYSRSATTTIAGDTSRAYDERHGWYRKFGNTALSAFEAVRHQVVEVALAARDGRLDVIDASPLGEAYRWKIAFHYQSRDSPQIVCVFSRKPLLAFLALSQSEKRVPLSKLYRDVVKRRRGEETIVAFSERVWKDWVFNNPCVVKLSEGAIRNGFLRVNLASAPFPETMHGGRTGAELGEVARFRTDTGEEFESDLYISKPGVDTGRLRHRLGSYFSAIGAKVGDKIFITPEAEGIYLVSRKSTGRVGNGAVVGSPPVAQVATQASVMSNAPLNQILFGPPGTGKTYEAVSKAVEILDPVLVATQGATQEARSVIKRRFDELTRAGQVQFVTFHQSFSYEDFVEGLRAETDEETGGLRYEVADGIFKRLCDAARARVVQEATVDFELTGRRIWKLSLGSNHPSDAYIYEECIAKSVLLIGYGAAADFSECRTREDVRNVFAAAGEQLSLGDYPISAIYIFLREVKKGDVVVVTDGNLKFRAIGEVTGDYRVVPQSGQDTYAQCRDVRWLRTYSPSLPYDQVMDNRFSQKTIYELREGSIDLEKLRGLLRSHDAATTSGAQTCVLIIDEINRGNVSRIFGELITLLDPSKRGGADEALSVVLPYSKERFSVPENVYLIGTMNTADRSLTGMDIALRRRFEFVEMPARPDLLVGVSVDGIDIAKMLHSMNQRIEVLLDRDHHLGHAYFLPLRSDPTLPRLAKIFRNQIVPLLQEYFFEDWERIRWVLNDQNKGEGHSFVVSPQQNVTGLFGGSSEVPVDVRIWSLDNEAFDRRESYIGIRGS